MAWKVTSSCPPADTVKLVSNTVLPPHVTLFNGFCESSLSPVAPCHVWVPVLSHDTVALNVCPGVSVEGTVCDKNNESYCVPAAVTAMERAFCAVPEAESATCTVKLNVPAVVGKPAMTPAGVKVKPGGSPPEKR